MIKKQIQALESSKNKKSWIIEGFPRTKRQALTLTEQDFIPDKIIMIDVNDEESERRVIENLSSEEAGL